MPDRLRVMRPWALTAGLRVLASSPIAAAEPEVFPEPPPPAPAPAPAPATSTVAEPSLLHAATFVVVHIDAPRDVELEVRRGSEWQVVCASPCDRPLSLDDNYRISGPGVRPSYGFRFDPANRTTLQVDPTSSAGHTFAVVVTAVGAVGFVPGIVTTVIFLGGMFFALILICPLVDDLGTRTTRQYDQCLGDAAGILDQFYALPGVWVPALAGLAMVTGGALGINATPQSKVTQSQTRGDPPASASRTPLWSDGVRGLVPQPVTFPIVEVRF